MTERKYDGALIDLDGTVYLGEQLIPGAADAVSELRNRGTDVLFLSNKPIKRREEYSELLTGLGIPTTVDEVINSSSISASYLQQHHSDDMIMVVGEQALREELLEAGLVLTDNYAEADVLLASMDRDFDYAKLTDALYAVDHETTFLATNPDRTCPTDNGEIPDAGAIVGAIEGASGVDLDKVLGKPSETAVAAAARALQTEPERCVMIGDRMGTDIKMANRADMTSVLVLTGVTDRKELERFDESPDYILESIANVESIL